MRSRLTRLLCVGLGVLAITIATIAGQETATPAPAAPKVMAGRAKGGFFHRGGGFRGEGRARGGGGLGERRRKPPRRSGSREDVPGERTRAESGRAVKEPRSGKHAAADRREGPRRLLRRQDRR